MALSSSFWGTSSSPTASTMPQPKQTTTKSKGPGGVKGFLLNSLPAVGATIGGVAALPLNALDAVTGVGGTALDLGAAAAGGSAGEALKEKLSGQKLSGKDIATQGALGAAGEGAGQVIGKVGASVLPKLLSKNATPVADALQGKSTKIVLGQIAGNLPSNSIRTGSQLGSLNEKADLATSLGLYSGADRQKAASLVTGPNGLVNKLKQTVLGNAGPLPALGGIKDATTKAIVENGVSGAADKKAVTEAINAQVAKANPQGSIATMTDAPSVFKTQQNIEKLAATERAKGNLNVSNAYRDVAAHIGSQIDQHTGVNDLVSSLTVPEDEMSKFVGVASKQFGKNKGNALANYVQDAVAHAKSLPDLRAIEANFIPGAQAETNSAIRGVQTPADSMLGNLAGASVSPFGKLGLVKTLASKVSGPEAALFGHAANAVTPIEQNLPNVVQRLLGRSGVNGLAGGSTSVADTGTAPETPQAESPAEGAVTLSDSPSGGASSGMGGSDSSDSGSVFSPQVLQALAISDLEKTGGKNLSSIATLASLFGAKGSQSSTPSSSSVVKPTSQQLGEAQSGESSLQSLEGMIQSNPGIVSKTAIPGQNLPVIGGLVKRLSGTGDYQAAASNTLDALARARTGAAMSKTEQAFYQKLLPQAGDSSDTVQYKLQQLQSALEPFLSSQDVSQ